MTDFDPFSNKPDISPSSRKLYTFNLTKLNGGKIIKDLKFLSDPTILGKLEEMKPNTRRTYLISIVSCLKDRPEAKYRKLYAKYYTHLVELNKQLKDNTDKTEKVKENWIEQDDVNSKMEGMKEVLKDLEKNKKLTEKEYETLLHTLILALYTLQQPRRNKDYTDMMMVRGVPSSTEHNYLNLDNMEWIFNNYKTQKKYSQQILKVPDELQDIIRIYLKFHPSSKEVKKKKMSPVPFLVHQDGTAVKTSTEMTRILNKIFQKKVGCSLLRAIFLTDKYGKQSQELKQDTKAMGTSVETAQNNYIKKED